MELYQDLCYETVGDETEMKQVTSQEDHFKAVKASFKGRTDHSGNSLVTNEK